MSTSVLSKHTRRWLPSRSVHLETGPGAKPDTQDVPQNISLPASVWATKKWLQGRREPLQLLQQPQDNQPWAGDEAKCLHLASRATGAPQRTAPPLCFPRHASWTSAVQALPHRSTPFSRRRALSRTAPSFCGRHLSATVATLAREGLLTESAEGWR